MVQRRLTHYRVPFFEILRRQSALKDIELVVAYGQGTEEENSKHDSAELSWGQRLTTRYLAGGRVCFQPLGNVTQGADMLVVTHENKLISNLWHQFLPVPYRVGLWGHGANLQGDPNSLRERFKRKVATHADWWFGYTSMSLPLIARTGFPMDRVTLLNNSVDTAEMAAMRDRVSPETLTKLRAELQLKGDLVGIFVGSLYAEKRIEFLLESASAIHDALPAFEFLVMGSGPQRTMVEAFCRTNPWAKYLGAQKGQAKVDSLALAAVMLNPGAVGLGILDSFVCGVPMLTTDCNLHGPEIAYLDSGSNGLMTANDKTAYVDSAVQLLQCKTALENLRKGCLLGAQKYTLQNMAGNFVEGLLTCLAAPKQRRKLGA